MSTPTNNHSGAERVRESILLLLAQSGSLTAAEIYEKIDTVETRQLLYAQINFLKKEGKIESEQGKIVPEQGKGEPTRYKLSMPLKEIIKDEATKNGVGHLETQADEGNAMTEQSDLPAEFVVEIRTAHRFVWEVLGRKHAFTLALRNGMWHLTARRSIPVTPAMLRDMADRIEDSYR